MKAVQINQYGGVEVLEINENTPKPKVSKGRVLVKVHAASINPFDWKVREGFLKQVIPLKFPIILGGDFAGVVTEIGEGVTEFTVGDEVYGQASLGSGSFSQFIASNAASAAYKPTSVDFISAAALPLVGSSAIQALEKHIKLVSKQKILIHGGAGGIGHVAIQLAKALGAYVITTVSTNDINFTKSLGADEAIDYKRQKFEEMVKEVDAVFDTVGGETTDRSFTVLKKGGVLVSMVGEPNRELAKQYGVTVIGQMTQTNSKHLNRLQELVDSGKITVAIDKVYPLEKIQEAFTYQEKIHPRGKVVLKMI